jgi:hypothetical protein
VVEHLPSKRKVLNSDLSLAKKMIIYCNESYLKLRNSLVLEVST